MTAPASEAGSISCDTLSNSSVAAMELDSQRRGTRRIAKPASPREGTTLKRNEETSFFGAEMAKAFRFEWLSSVVHTVLFVATLAMMIAPIILPGADAPTLEDAKSERALIFWAVLPVISSSMLILTGLVEWELWLETAIRSYKSVLVAQ